MNRDLKEFESIWRYYYNLLPINNYEFDLYMRIMNKIRTNNVNFSSNEKTSFIDLLRVMSHTIYNYKKENEEEKMDRELDCCYRIKQRLL